MSEIAALRTGLYREKPEPTLLGSRCRACGHVHFPSTENCVACRSPEVDVVELGADATLFCETTVHMKTPRFAAGYRVGYVTLADGVRVFSQLRAVEGKPLRIGMPMKLEIAPLWQEDGQDIRAYRFYPA